VRDFRWRRLAPDEVRGLSRVPVDPATLEMAGEIVRDVGEKGEAAVRRYAERFGELEPGQPWIVEADELRRVLVELEGSQRALLERAAERIERFAVAQRDSVRDFSLPVSGGFVGQQLAPVERAGCYAPGGRYPLPSSVLMTAVTARVAGVGEVWVASPRPQPMQLAAAAVRRRSLHWLWALDLSSRATWLWAPATAGSPQPNSWWQGGLASICSLDLPSSSCWPMPVPIQP